MRTGFRSGLIPQGFLVVLLIIIIIFVPSNVLRIILGLPLVLFFPGYSLTLALFPGKDQLGNVERLALSFGLSIAIVPLMGLILNYTPWGITLESTLGSITGFIFIMSTVAWLRLRRLAEPDRFGVDFKIKRLGWGGSRWDRALSVVLILSMLAAMGVLGYILSSPKVGEKFTEFYVLGLEGEASDYPTDMSVDEEATVILGIVNREQEDTDYRVEIVVSGKKQSEIGPLPLEHDQLWENIVAFSVDNPGADQKVEFLLYKSNQSSVYRAIHLWIDVS